MTSEPSNKRVDVTDDEGKNREMLELWERTTIPLKNKKVGNDFIQGNKEI